MESRITKIYIECYFLSVRVGIFTMAAPLIIEKHNGKELEVKKCVILHTMSVGRRRANCRLTRVRRALRPRT